MGLFRIERKDKPPKAEDYTVPDNIPPPLPPPQQNKTDLILQNQGVIVQNQQVILNEIGKLGAWLEEHATTAEESPEDEELSEEEIAAAVEAFKAKKKPGRPPKK